MENLQACCGWFKCFRRRFNLFNVQVTGEAASTDGGAAEKFVDTLDRII